MKAVIQSFVTMGFDETDSMRSTIEVYWRYFEIPFLEATSTYYQRVSKSFLHTHSLTEYLAKVTILGNSVCYLCS